MSDFPEKTVTKIYSSTLLALRGGGRVSNFQKKTLRNTCMAPNIMHFIVNSIRVGASSFHSPSSSIFCLSSRYAPVCFIVFYDGISLPQFWPSYLSVSIHFHLVITTSSCVFLSACSNHHSLPSVIVPLLFAMPLSLLPIIHLSILISVLSGKSCSAFLSAKVSLPYIEQV